MTQLCHAEATNVLKFSSSHSQLFVIVSDPKVDQCLNENSELQAYQYVTYSIIILTLLDPQQEIASWYILAC